MIEEFVDASKDEYVDTPIRLSAQGARGLYFVYYHPHNAPIAEISFERGVWQLHYRPNFAVTLSLEEQADFNRAMEAPLKDYVAVCRVTSRMFPERK